MNNNTEDIINYTLNKIREYMAEGNHKYINYSHSHEDDDHDDHTFSTVDETGSDITFEEVEEIVTKVITKKLDKYGRIFLYICPDNELISIEDIDPEVTEEDLSVFEEGLPNLFVGFD